MARKKTARNNHLEEAMALLMQSQAALMQNQTALSQQQIASMQQQTALMQQQAAFLERLSETDRELAQLRRQTDERFGRIETILLEHSRILSELMRMMEALPEAIREKIGFKPSR